MKFRFEFETLANQGPPCKCPLHREDFWASTVGYCYEKPDDCKGDLSDRPEWCPLKEVKDEEIEVEA
jgi:hypothetical protein